MPSSCRLILEDCRAMSLASILAAADITAVDGCGGEALNLCGTND